MGVSKSEIDDVLKDAEANLRIAGFEEEEKRIKQRMSKGSRFPLKLPQGAYIFCDFRTLELPGVEVLMLYYIILFYCLWAVIVKDNQTKERVENLQGFKEQLVL